MSTRPIVLELSSDEALNLVNVLASQADKNSATKRTLMNVIKAYGREHAQRDHRGGLNPDTSRGIELDLSYPKVSYVDDGAGCVEGVPE